MLSMDEALDLLRRAVREKGADYIDPNAEKDGCKYIDEETEEAACIVGHVFAYLDWLKYVGPSSNTDSVDQIASYGDFPVISGDAVLLLRHAQARQDVGDTWGDALSVAERVYEDIRTGVHVGLA